MKPLAVIALYVVSYLVHLDIVHIKHIDSPIFIVQFVYDGKYNILSKTP